MSQNPSLADALRVTAHRLAADATPYRWTHQGRCNCGHLAQTLTSRDAPSIHAAGLEVDGDWSEHARGFCPTSGLAIDAILATMFDAGVTPDELVHLERLSDPRVLRRLGVSVLDYRERGDVVRYLEAWAALVA
ncbi:MAG: hypothetical protein U1F43_10035 [Myxococcota bacterium]